MAPSLVDAVLRAFLDENVSERLALLLRWLGHDVVSANALGYKGTTDPRLLLAASRDDRLLVTHNAGDFVLIHETLQLWASEWAVAGARRHAGIVLIPDSGTLATAEAARQLDRLAKHHSAFEDRLLVWKADDRWDEPFPGVR